MIQIDNEFRSLIMPLTAQERQQLHDNILADGIRDPLVLWGDILLDGHNRYEIALDYDLPFNTVQVECADREAAKLWIINNQIGRRNITPQYMSYLIGKRYEMEKKPVGAPAGNENAKKQSGQNDHFEKTEERIADDMGVSTKTVRRNADYAAAVDTIAKVAGEDAKNAILTGETRITKKDMREIETLAQEAPDLLPQVASGELSIPAAKREIVKRERENAPELPTPHNKYRILYADPPWKYNDSGIIDEDNYGRAERHYTTMSISELCALSQKIKELSENNAVLFMWTTSPFLEDAFKVINAWGFKYKTSFVWDKVKHNFGHYNSVRHEFLLVCTRGSCTPDNLKLFDSVQSIERSSTHSEKPEQFREIIETLYTHGDRIELFARKSISGWDTWGNEL